MEGRQSVFAKSNLKQRRVKKIQFYTAEMRTRNILKKERQVSQ